MGVTAHVTRPHIQKEPVNRGQGETTTLANGVWGGLGCPSTSPL